MPIAATSQSVAAVVRPRIENPWRMIAPAPRKPMPLTTCAAIRVGSARTTASPLVRNSVKPYAETIVKSAEPTETSRCVRRPASRSRSSRSSPIAPPSSAAVPSRSITPVQCSVGIAKTRGLCKWCRRGFELRFRDFGDPAGREIDQLVQLLARERVALRGRLHLDEPSVAGQHDVHVRVRRRVLRVVEVEQRDTVNDTDGHCGDRVAQSLREAEAVERAARRDVRAADRRAARAAVGLQHVTVEPERPLAERFEVEDRTNRAADQPLNLDGAAALLPARRLALSAVAGRSGQQRVLSRHPAATGAVEPARHALLHRRRAEHHRLPLNPKRRAVRLLDEVGAHLERAQLVRAAAVVPAHAAASASAASVTCSTAATGSCRKRRPWARNAGGSPVVRKRYVPSRALSFSIPLRASVCATSRAVSSAEKTSVTSRPKTRCRTGRING